MAYRKDSELTPDELARRIANRERQAKYRAKHKGKPKGKMAQRQDADESVTFTEGTARSLDEARTIKLQLEIETMRGNLVEASTVKAAIARRVAALKSAIDAAPARYKSKRPDAKPEDIAALRSVLSDLARDFEEAGRAS